MPGPSAEGGISYIVDPFKFPIIGEVSFACSTTEYQWQVPTGITSITAILIGGGGGGGCGSNQQERAGGGGGALRWVNGLVVQPGETLRIGAGVGGTAQDSATLDALYGNKKAFFWSRPGAHSYIASSNNANVPARAGIAGTIIVIAEGGGWDGYVSDTVRINPFNSTQLTEGVVQGQGGTQTVGVGTSGGQGTAFGSYTWGTVGGGNGGTGGSGDGVGGGQDGGGGGAGGYSGTGGRGGTAGGTAASVGTGGAGGGGMFGSQGGGNGAGGGGGVGVYWGIGPNGQRGGYYRNGTTFFYNDNISSNSLAGAGGQAGSFGADGKASGCDAIQEANISTIYTATGFTNYPNGSNGNGKRGYVSSVDDITGLYSRGDGGLYGGGGGGADGGQEQPQSGAGGCGHVRILFVARTDLIVREYGSGRTTQLRTIKGSNETINFYDWNPNLSFQANEKPFYGGTGNWPVWNPTPSGQYYNLLTNWGVNLPEQPEVPDAVTAGISTLA